MDFGDKNIWAIIPALNESTAIESVIHGLRGEGFKKIVVVDDGSTDGTGKIASRAGATVVRHTVNLGTGAATETGFEYIRRNEEHVDAVVTCDADGQHTPSDARRVVEVLIQSECDLVVGSRIMKNAGSMPVVRLLGNKVVNVLVELALGIKMSDSQCGLRALSNKALAVMKLKSLSWEFLTEMIKIARQHKMRIMETSIQTIYTPYSLTKIKDYTYVLNIIKYVMIKN